MNIKLDPNDKLFSVMIRERDKDTCVFCPKSATDGWRMTNSHYWGRGDKIHRFDPLNCDTLCFECHQKHESNKQGYYRTWKINQLGEEVYKVMEVNHYQGSKKYGAYEKALLNKILKEQYKNKEHLNINWKVMW